MYPTCKLTGLQMRVENMRFLVQKPSSSFSQPSRQHEHGIGTGSPCPPKSHGSSWRGPGECCSHRGFASQLRDSKLRKPHPLQREVSVPDFRPTGRRYPGWTAPYKHLLSALHPGGGRYVFQGYLLNNIPKDRVYNKGRQGRCSPDEQKYKRPLENCLETFTAHRQRVLPDPWGSTAWSRQGCFLQGMSLSLILKDGRDNLPLWCGPS